MVSLDSLVSSQHEEFVCVSVCVPGMLDVRDVFNC